MSCNKFPEPSVQRPSRAQQCCILPVNSGSNVIGINERQQRYFDNMFDPFTPLYQCTNFVCKPRNNTAFPVATNGTGSFRKGKKCRTNPIDCCATDGNPNNNTLNIFEAQDQCFDDQYNPLTDKYQQDFSYCKNRKPPTYGYGLHWIESSLFNEQSESLVRFNV